MDSSFIAIGDSIAVSRALVPNLGFLFDGNQATYQIDSDTTPRLLHIQVRRVPGQEGWTAVLENWTLEAIDKIYSDYNDLGVYDPPRVVDNAGQPVPATEAGVQTALAGGEAPFLGKRAVPGREAYPESGNGFQFNFQMKDVVVPDVPPVYPTELVLKGEQRWRWAYLQEVGTYIIPVAYHRTTDKGFQCLQVLRSDASFWPMPAHTAWSIQDNWQDLWRYPDRAFDPTIKGYDSP